MGRFLDAHTYIADELVYHELAQMLKDEGSLKVSDIKTKYRVTDEKETKRLISDTIKDIGTHDFTITGIVEEGDAAAKIIDVANRLQVELIVLGSKGTSEIGRYPIGSVANKVVQYAHKPVMLVR